MKNLGPKLVKVLESVDKVKKTGFNSHQNYHYATEADILDAIREGLIANKVFISESSEITDVTPITNKDGKTSFITSVKTTHTFIDAESGETHSVTSTGQGHDAQDKGVYKAITGATKYFYMKNFMVSTGDDPEADGSKTNKPSPQQAKPAQGGGFKMPGAAPAQQAAPVAQASRQGMPAPKPAGVGMPKPSAPKAAAPKQASKFDFVPPSIPVDEVIYQEESAPQDYEQETEETPY